MHSTMMTGVRQSGLVSKTFNNLTCAVVIGLAGFALAVSPASALVTGANNSLRQQLKENSAIIDVYVAGADMSPAVRAAASWRDAPLLFGRVIVRAMLVGLAPVGTGGLRAARSPRVLRLDSSPPPPLRHGRVRLRRPVTAGTTRTQAGPRGSGTLVRSSVSEIGNPASGISKFRAR